MLFLCLMTLSVVVATWAAVGRPTLYRSSASLWSDTATGAASAIGLPPPASQEQTMLNELLTTQFFRSKVAREAPLADYLEAHPVEGWGLGPSAILARLRPTPSVDDRIQEALGPGRVTSLVQGPHVLEVRFDAPTPELAYRTLTVLMQQFQEQRSVLRRDVLAASRVRVERASQALAAARRDLNAYLSDHARDASDPRLRTLSETERSAVLQLATATESLNQETRDVLSGAAGEATLRVIDAPDIPVAPTTGKKTIVMAMAAGLFVGAILSVLGIVALTRIGGSGRAEDESVWWDDEAAGPERPRLEDEPLAAETLAARRRSMEQPRLERPG